ncbi:nuclear transport factor 2 family protein [Rodentibacter myodis]|uniref:DUF4440 domain-containing protein n=1 Tax=Rodentibacter myodis TaxID=1907939 RepID=A0A1V3JSL5_9PAST|nr:nuclear transport factor 2 family protein [Rodentibacter myodis]OOF59639.1 hypothetical protein BKL49_02270 [Rodentibacter myodis]
MKKIEFWHSIVAVILGLSVSVAAGYPAIKTIQAEREQTKSYIIKLDKILRDALIKNDLEKISRLLSDDFELYTIKRGVLNKQQWLEEIRSGRMNYKEFANDRRMLFQGKQISGVVEISGVFWGHQAENYPIEMSIRAVERNDKQRIKCITLKNIF